MTGRTPAFKEVRMKTLLRSVLVVLVAPLAAAAACTFYTSGNDAYFDGCNVHVVNGAGSTGTMNGLGNLIVGYNANPGAQTGSHNLVVGDAQTFTSYAGAVFGESNTIS